MIRSVRRTFALGGVLMASTFTALAVPAALPSGSAPGAPQEAHAGIAPFPGLWLDNVMCAGPLDGQAVCGEGGEIA